MDSTYQIVNVEREKNSATNTPYHLITPNLY